MKKLRVFQTVKIKRIVPGFSPGNLGTVFLFFILTPYLITFFLGNLREGDIKQVLSEEADQEGVYSVFISNETSFGSERIPLEDYVADKLARSMDNAYETEALKAQAVLIRSSLLSKGEGENKKEIKVEDGDYGKISVTERILEAVRETKGVYITYEDLPASGAYFAVSNGKTRNGKEMMLDEYPYLTSVSCERDFLSEDFNSVTVYTEKEFEEIWGGIKTIRLLEDEILEKGQITTEKALEKYTLYRDSADYVLYIEREGGYVSGEQFRSAFYLPSASFHLGREEDKVIITVKGAGHGLGMSQFGANEMAKEGSDYICILNYFFKDVTITKFE